MFNKYLNSEKGQILISIIWGLGISCLFKKVCEGKSCVIYKAPNPNNIINKIFKYKNKCYKFKKINTKCTKNVIME